MERSYDGVDLTASDATDVMDEEGWFEDDFIYQASQYKRSRTI